ncbi:alpha/beta hydrolase [Laribacter hongkongensis]|uniref:alpha/beta hydrolase n=1 Tax=Laribacter hongkongensis TaxID=168471 RepID=UPI001EFCDD62|nr:alpha/beta fold hydrolase [Laribacter hongkongensis]MCG8991343.1 alpha/beta hydrolase [Laribacter hongkongensis]MCG9000507.1 alpha/beta hydrolase [Laribacter hongkongensis]MCG9006972.1 alpha/beta hydrolase [Laribacter hongkongensis]MCG9015358.1 alpha/beta hydrolase [Laribacter hongkongensis]
MTNSLLFLAGCALLLLGGHLALLRALRAPRRRHESGWPQARPVRIATVNRRQLAALWWPARHTGAPVLLMMHGWGGNGSDLAPAAEAAHAAGYAVLLPDARCHGRSDGDSFASLPRFAEDIDAALAWLHASHPDSPVALLGHSLGAAACILVASRRNDIAAVVSISAFAHPEELMQRWLASQGRWLRWLSPLILGHVQRVIGQRFESIAPVNLVSSINCPLLILHGRHDNTVPADDALRLAAARPQAECLLLDGDHESFADMASAVSLVLGFLARHLSTGTAATPMNTIKTDTLRIPAGGD